MEVIGDLERAFASALYPNRLLIGGVALVAAALVLMVAWRRRWDRPVRRHPRRSAIGALAVAAVAGPMGWYLGSPLFLSSTVDEPAPVVVAAAPTPLATAAPATPRPTTSAAAPVSPTATQTPSPTATPVPLIERTGRFRGADEFHFGRGTARLIETAPGTFTVRLEGFEVRNGPDLHVYLSPSGKGYANAAVELGRLKADKGNQNYRVPEGVDIGSAKSVVIWCKQFSVLFATAPLA